LESSVGDLSHQKIMKLNGKINEVPIIVILDSGATYNFMRLVEALGLEVNETRSLGFQLGDVHKGGANRKCPKDNGGIEGFKYLCSSLCIWLRGIWIWYKIWYKECHG